MANVIDVPDFKTALTLAKKDLNIQTPKTFQEAAAIIGKALELIIISKNHKYGKGNILNAKQFGIDPRQGTALRMNDKFERLKNGLKGMDLGEEGFLDTWGDLMGYSVVGLLLELKWYELEIA